MNKKIVLFGGSFDLLHYGHVQQIRKAKACGDYLIVNVSSDEQARGKKGKGRPIIPEQERLKMVLALEYVDKAIIFRTTELDLPWILDHIEPSINVLVTNKGNNDYDEECKKRGIELVKLKRCVPPSKLDTTGIINKIRKER